MRSLDSPSHAPPQVPWGGRETAFGMVAWVASFLAVGLLFVPVVKSLAGPEGFAGLSAGDKGQFALANQIVETAVTLAVVRLGVAKFEPLPADLFRYDFRCVCGGGRPVCV